MRVTAEFLQRLSCFFFHNNDNISEIQFPDQSAPIFAIANLLIGARSGPRGGSLASWLIITVVQNMLPPQTRSFGLPSKSSNPIKIKGFWKTQDNKKVSGCNIMLLQGSIN